MQQELCGQANGHKKVSYRTRAAAEKKRRQGHDVALHVYGPCRHCGGYHLTSEPQRTAPPKAPSLARLRRHLDAVTQQIAAQQRRLDAAEKQLAAEQEKAEQKTAGQPKQRMPRNYERSKS